MGKEAPSKFIPFPRAVSKRFRERVLSTYPALAAETATGRAYRAMAEYCIFNVHANRNGEGIILPFRTLAQLVGVSPSRKGFAAHRWIDDFSQEVFDLRPLPYSYVAGEARVIRPEIASDILAERDLELTEALAPDYERVYFVDGRRVSLRKRLEVGRDYVRYLKDLANCSRPEHPARELVEFLNSQPPDCLEKLLKANWPALRRAALEMPQGTLQERRRRDAALRVLLGVMDHRVMLYGTSVKTLRIHALGSNIHLLPRELRRLALRGSIHLDLRACQLAVVAKLWNIPALQEFLATGKSIWKELLACLGLDDRSKPILKRTVYSALFGMGYKKLRQQLADGIDDNGGVGREKMQAFFRDPRIDGLMKARRAVQQTIKGTGGVADAFGQWLTTSQYSIPSVLAQQVQSYEVKIMLSMLPILKAEKDIRVLSWLHDGLTIRILDPAEKQRKLRRLCDVVEDAASVLGFHTVLEVEDDLFGGSGPRITSGRVLPSNSA